MAEPTSKTSHSKKGMRRSHKALARPTVWNCPNCGAMIQPHNVCNECGYYRNKEVMQPKI
jgi:large subunit ribosomal protein L32